MIQGKSMHLAFEAERLSSVFYFRSSGFYACLGEFPGGGNVILQGFFLSKITSCSDFSRCVCM